MTINISKLLTPLCLLVTTALFSQSNSLSSSPYSLFGMGTFNTSNTGKTVGLGNTGIANSSSTFINNLNPASMATIPLKTFFFDVGLKSEYGVQIEDGSKDTKNVANFSNMAFGFPLTKKSGVSVTLIPYTSVGYGISNIKTDIEGSTSYFLSNIEGSGGLNDLKLNYGYKLLDNLNIGATGSVLFGQIIETERSYIGSNTLTIYDTNSYSGFQFGAGIQYSPLENVTVGSVITFPSLLDGTQNRTVSQFYDSDIEYDQDLDAFELPLEVGVGIQTEFMDQVSVSLDYTKKFWNDTDQTDELGTFVDQNILGVGVEFDPNGNQLKFWNTVEYRAGFNYDSGYLEINNHKVHDYGFDLGIGIPLRYDGFSMLNIAYTYGKKGQVYDGLIQENYHMLTLNISLAGQWFVKRKIQ
ncbi:hypothetical protein [Formosa sediminum]|nr:hypothetical protein [Formosa sediminum]